MFCTKIVVILGPTCTGKTTLAVKLCKEFNGEIVSADSRQIFKFMDIGTGKLPTDKNVTVTKGDGFWEQDGIKIRCYDLAMPNANFTVVDYARAAKSEIESILRRGKVPFLVGGTGFYIDVLLGRSSVSQVLPNWELRDSLKNTPAEKILEKLVVVNPDAATTIDNKNPVRLIRALEIALNENKYKSKPYKPLSTKPLFIGLTASHSYLFNKADIFVDNLLKRGILEEIELLIIKGYINSRPLTGLIYDQFIKNYQKEISLEDCLERAKFDTHAYIRRQLTWFNRNSEASWFNTQDKNLCDLIRSSIQSYLYGS